MKVEGSLEQKGLISAGQVSATGAKTTSPGLASAEKTLDLNEDLKLAGKRVHQESSETKAGGGKTTGRWTKAEHARFLEGKPSYLQIALKLYGKHWKLVEKHVGTRSGTQVRSHAQKYYMKTGIQKVKEEDANQSVVPIVEEGQQRISDVEMSKEEVSVNETINPMQLVVKDEQKNILQQPLSLPENQVEEQKANNKTNEPIQEHSKGNSYMSEDIKLPSITAEALNNILLNLKDNDSIEEQEKYERHLLELRHSTNLFMYRVGEVTNSDPKAIEVLEEECKTILNLLSNIMEHILLRTL